MDVIQLLVYFLANNNGRLVNCDLNFNGKFSFHYNEVNKSLEIKKNDNYLEGYWGSNIKSFTTIAGNNGIGKTSILELIKDRFLWGFNHPEKTILITKQNNQFKICYDQGLFKEDNKIDINGVSYDVPNSIFNVEDKINSIEILELGLELVVKKVSPTEKLKKKIDLQINTRLGDKRAIVFYTNSWNYDRRHRIYKQNVESKGLEYFDYSIGDKIDSLVNQESNYEVNISDVGSIYEKVKDTRFKVDYLFKLKEQEMINTLRYLKESDAYEFISETLTIPEEIYIYYDFLDSQKRNSLFSLNEDRYLRFEKTNENFLLENNIYNYLLKDKSRVKLNNAMILILIERLFVDLKLMIPNHEINKQAKLVDSKELYEISDLSDINKLLTKFKNKMLITIKAKEFTEVYKENDRNILIEKVEGLISSYINFIDYLITDFFGKIDNYETETSIFEVTKSGEISKHIKIEVPIIKVDKLHSQTAYEFFSEYSKLVSRNKPFYFAWRGLSSGEVQLLNLFTSLASAIEESQKENILILLDEAEISLHPMLQKKFIKMLVHLLNTKAQQQAKDVQIILTTHSPFVLSELPFNSLILLEKNSQDIVTIKNELENLTATLGANVHKLFSHSFFLTGGLIGDFATDKINEVANNLLGIQSNLTQSYIKKFINQVGEPIIKTRLLELYEQKWKLDKPLEIQNIQNEIEELKKKLIALEEKGE